MRVFACGNIEPNAFLPSEFGMEAENHLRVIRNLGKQRASVSAWNLLLRVMREQKISDIPKVSFTQMGKPFFVDSPLYFSISHSGSMCAVSLANVETGVDIEIVRAEYSPALVKRTISEKEMRIYDGDFTRLWCKKECLVKLSGTGINEHPSKIDTLTDSVSLFEETVIDYSGREYRLVAAFENLPGDGTKPSFVNFS